MSSDGRIFKASLRGSEGAAGERGGAAPSNCKHDTCMMGSRRTDTRVGGTMLPKANDILSICLCIVEYDNRSI